MDNKIKPGGMYFNAISESYYLHYGHISLVVTNFEVYLKNVLVHISFSFIYFAIKFKTQTNQNTMKLWGRLLTNKTEFSRQ